MTWRVKLPNGKAVDVTEEELDLPYDSYDEYKAALHEAAKKKS